MQLVQQRWSALLVMPYKRRHLFIIECTYHVECWFVGDDDLTGALHDLELQLSPPPPSSLASIELANLGSPEKMAVKRRERDIYIYTYPVYQYVCMQ